VRHAGNETDVTIGQGDGDGWVNLGEFDFAAGGDQWVAVYDNTGEDGGLEAKVIVDAVRLSPAGATSECDPSECANRGACGEWSACSGFEDGCDESGTQTRTCETYACEGSTCVRGTDDMEQQACVRQITDELGEWGPASECGGFESLCDEDGVLVEVRDACVGGVSSSESREVACTRSTDGIVTSIWGPWGACDAGINEEARSRSICESGIESAQVQARACSDSGNGDGGGRVAPTVTSRSGCVAAPRSRAGLMLGLLVLLLAGRRRRRA
jgi:hypothetical protein